MDGPMSKMEGLEENSLPISIRTPEGATIDPSALAWSKYPDRLMPATIQDARSKRVLMKGYMNLDTLEETLVSKKVVFFSRSRSVRWMKGETSKNYLLVSEDQDAIRCDCDRDDLLILVNPIGPTCHNGTTSCFGEKDPPSISDWEPLKELEETIDRRKKEMPEGSYTTALFAGGTIKIAKKVGEEAVEVALAAVAEDTKRLISESADLLYHLMVLWHATGNSLTDVVKELAQRNPPKPPSPPRQSSAPT